MTHFVKLERPSMWRRLARAGWGSPNDPSIHGFVDIDMTNALAFIEEIREATGARVTITHLVTKAIAMAIREYPMLNGIIRWDGFYLRKTIDIFVLAARDHDQVAIGGGLSGVKVPQADHRTIVEIAQHLQAKVPAVVAHKDKELEPTERALKWLPGMLLRPVLQLIDLLTFEMDLDLRKAGVPYDQFGTAVVTNVGMLGLSKGFAPIYPPSRCPLVIAVGEVRSEPMVVGKKVMPRPRLVIGCTVDHRFIDGLGAARLARRFRELLNDPRAHFASELKQSRAAAATSRKTPRKKPVARKPPTPTKIAGAKPRSRTNGSTQPEPPAASVQENP